MQNVETAVELICAKGCKTVNQIRGKLDRGETVAEVSGMSFQERFEVKKELDEIMSVYELKKEIVLPVL